MVLRSDLYKFSTYLQSSYVSLTTRKRVTCKNGEGSNACVLPCGVGGVGGSVGGVGNEENRPVARPARTQALQFGEWVYSQVSVCARGPEAFTGVPLVEDGEALERPEKGLQRATGKHCRSAVGTVGGEVTTP